MNNLFSNILDICVIVYLDNILIYLNNMFKHYWHIKKVLKHFCKASLYAKAKKCKFYSKLVKYCQVQSTLEVEVHKINSKICKLMEQP